MIELNLVNQSEIRMPRAKLEAWVRALEKNLRRRKVLKLKAVALTVVFLDPKPAQALNKQYRGRNYPTDVLSFSSEDGLGDLVLCPAVLQKQAHEHDLSFFEETGYMVIHGVLHLLGFDHEKTKKEAEKMFRLQDDIFEDLLKSSRR